MLVCRLRADAASLRQRILARTRGGGPQLAGDALIGVSHGEAETVLRRALAEQSRLREPEIADTVLDTTGDTAEAVIHRLRTAFDRQTEG